MMQATLFPEPVSARLDDGDRAAVAQWLPMLIGKANKFRGSQDYEDAQQEAALAALISLRTFNPDLSEVQTHMGSAAMFRLRTFANRCASRGYAGLKGKSNANDYVPRTSAIGDDHDVEHSDADLLAMHDEQMQLWNLVDRLPHDQRTVIRLRYICEWNTSTIAWHLGVYRADVLKLEAAARVALAEVIRGGQ